MHAINHRRIRGAAGTPRTPMDADQKRHRRHMRCKRAREHDDALVAISAARHGEQIARMRFPATRKRNKNGANVSYPAYTPKHFVGLRGMTGHRISFTQTKAEWVENVVR